MKKLALILMLLMLPSMAWAGSSVLECSASKGIYTIETFVWGGEHKIWTSITGWKTDEEWKVEYFSFEENATVSVSLRHVNHGRGKIITFNSGWACRNLLILGEE